MDVTEYSSYDGTALADMVKRGKVSPSELANLAAQAAARVNPRLNAVIEIFQDRVEGLKDPVVPSGPFAGVPFLMKDIGAGEAGRRQEFGSRFMAGNVVERDAFITERFKEAGLTLLGRTTTPEFALGASTESALCGATRNPWNLELMAGGSSGGSAASVAAGIVPMAHGSDNGGSIRIPASACGLVGLKPSHGRVTTGPDMGDMWPGLLVEFLVSRSVRDTAAMLDAVSAPAPGDPFIIPQPARPYAREVGAPVRPMRIAWTAASWQPETTTDPEIVDAVGEVVATLEKAGHTLVEASPTFDYEAYFKTMVNVWAFGLYAGMDMFAAMTGRPISEETLEPVMLSYYEYSKGIPAGEMFTQEFALNAFRRRFGEFFTKYDLFLTPTLVKLPQKIGTYSKMRKDIDYVAFMRENDSIRIHPPAANVTGQPALSLPLGWSPSGLPIGVQFMARFAEEDTLIRLASWLENALPWRNRIPPVHASR